MDPVQRIVGRDRETVDILERLRRGVGTVIVGGAGIGKSALVREVQARLRAQGQSTLFVAGGDWISAAHAITAAEIVAGSAAVVVDDAHLLDDGSAHQLSRLLGTARTPVLATVRTGDRPASSLGWLWAASASERLELSPLDGNEVRLLLEQQLRGVVDDQLAEVLAERTRGNPLLVNEMVEAGVQSGAVSRVRGSWRQSGALPLLGAAEDLIRGTLASLDEEELETLQLLALAQPVRLRLIERLVDLDVLEGLESRRMVVTDSEGDEPSVSCAHPLYAELLNHDLGVLRARRLRGRLLSVMGDDAARTERERLLCASWRLQLGRAVEHGELIACARIASTSAPDFAEQLLRVAIEPAVADEPSPEHQSAVIEAAGLLSHLLVLQGRVAEADQVLDRFEPGSSSVAPADLSDAQRQSLATVRVLVRTRLGEMSEALRLIGESPDPTAGGATALQTQALYAQLMLLSARLDEAVRTTQPLLVASVDVPVARSVAAYTVVAANSFAGRTEDTERALREALPILSATRDQLPFGVAFAQVSTAIAQVFAGHFVAAARLGQRMYDAAQQTQDPWLLPRSATVLGLLALYGGRADTAAAHLREAIAVLTPLDAMFIRYNLGFLARAAALAGNVAEARQALRPPPEAPVFPLYEADWQLAEAAVLAAEYRLAEAAERAMQAARIAAGHGQWGIAAVAAHDAARYAELPEAGALLTNVADLLDGPLPPLLRDHAVARALHDPARLHTVSIDFERLGAPLLAAEAAYAAVDVLHRDGRHREAGRLAVRATELHGRCENAFVPWALGRAADGLTTRERQVALLAAAGRPDRQISTQLSISVRTVQTHLTHVYTKLQVRSRTDLPDALVSDSSTRRGPLSLS